MDGVAPLLAFVLDMYDGKMASSEHSMGWMRSRFGTLCSELCFNTGLDEAYMVRTCT